MNWWSSKAEVAGCISATKTGSSGVEHASDHAVEDAAVPEVVEFDFSVEANDRLERLAATRLQRRHSSQVIHTLQHA